MKVERHGGILTGFERQVEVVLICIINIGDIGEDAFAGDFFKGIEEISFKRSVDMVLLDVKSGEDTVFITALALDRIRAHAKKFGKHDICVCLHRPNAQEFRSVNCHTKSFSVSYGEIHLEERVLADILTMSG